VVAKGGADVGVTSAFVLPMVGTMTIITSFLSPYLVKFGWKIGDRFKEVEEEEEEEPGEQSEQEEQEEQPRKED
jgi:CPA2 family monovalent cation:H+ antiporter-2